MKSRGTYARRFIILALVAVIIIAVRLAVGDDVFTLENLKKSSEQLSRLVSARPFISAVVFIGIYAFITGVSIPGATVMTLAGGFLYGTARGIILVNIGATAGATMAFLMARYFMGDWVQTRYGERLGEFNRNLDINGKNYLLTLRLIPVFPFFLINVFAGLTRINTLTFIWTTSLGIIPGSFVYTFAGSQLSNVQSLDDIFSVNMLAVLVALGLFSLVPVVYRKLKGNVKKNTGTDTKETVNISDFR